MVKLESNFFFKWNFVLRVGSDVNVKNYKNLYGWKIKKICFVWNYDIKSKYYIWDEMI